MSIGYSNKDLMDGSLTVQDLVENINPDKSEECVEIIKAHALSLSDPTKTLVILGRLLGLTLEEMGERLCALGRPSDYYDMDRDIVIEDATDAIERGISEDRVKKYIAAMLKLNPANNNTDFFMIDTLYQTAEEGKKWQYMSTPGELTRQRVQQIEEQAVQKIKELIDESC